MAKKSMDSGYMGMMSDDKSSMANMPQEKKMTYYPKQNYLGEPLDDTIREIDSTRSKNMGQLKGQASKTKY